jgi:hypothetical protein
MHFRAPPRNLAITLLLTGSVRGYNGEHPDTASDSDGTAGTTGGSGSQAEDIDDIDGAPSDTSWR